MLSPRLAYSLALLEMTEQNHPATIQTEFSSLASHFSLVQEWTFDLPGTGPGFKFWAGLRACLLASSRWELTLHSRPSPSEARLGHKYFMFCL